MRRLVDMPVRSAGFTLIEMMVVLAILGMLMVAVSTSGLIKTGGQRLREDTLELMATIRAAQRFSTQTGAHHRLLIDLEEQAYRIEICEGDVRLRKSDEEEVPDQEKIAELLEKPLTSDFDKEILEAESPEAAAAAAAALAGVRIGGSRCSLSPQVSGHIDGKGNLRSLDTARGIKIDEIWVQHLRDPADEGQVSINFFPLGYAEKAVIKVESEDGEQMNLLVHGLTGRVELRVGEVDPELHMHRDGAGDDLDDEDER